MAIGGVGGGAPMMRSFKPPTFESLDSNSSGDITLDELKAAAPGGADNTRSSERAEKLFAAMDADGSGSVSTDEKDAFDAKMKAAREAMQFMTQLMGSSGHQPPSNEDIFANTDTDGSGGVSLDEFSAGDAAKSLTTDQLSELFATIDSDGDGSITETESSDFLDTLKSAMGGPQGGPPPGGGPGGPGGPPPAGPPPDASAGSDDDEDTSAINLLTAATSAYASKQKSADLLSKLSSIFDQAA